MGREPRRGPDHADQVALDDLKRKRPDLGYGRGAPDFAWTAALTLHELARADEELALSALGFRLASLAGAPA